MSTSNYIPVGRTSLVKRGQVDVQVQTEYAPRPTPRVTTTISFSGQVLHKVERSLAEPIASLDEQRKTEREMRKQHDEILSIIEKESFASHLEMAPRSERTEKRLSVMDRLQAVPDVSHILRVDSEGNIVGEMSAQYLKKKYSSIFKNLTEILNLFLAVPGSYGERERGVVELDPDSLYFVSIGTECLFVLIEPGEERHRYEALINKAIEDNGA